MLTDYLINIYNEIDFAQCLPKHRSVKIAWSVVLIALDIHKIMFRREEKIQFRIRWHIRTRFIEEVKAKVKIYSNGCYIYERLVDLIRFNGRNFRWMSLFYDDYMFIDTMIKMFP